MVVSRNSSLKWNRCHDTRVGWRTRTRCRRPRMHGAAVSTMAMAEGKRSAEDDRDGERGRREGTADGGWNISAAGRRATASAASKEKVEKAAARNASPTKLFSVEALVNYVVAVVCLVGFGLVAVTTFDATGRILALSFEFGIVAAVLILAWIFFNDSDVNFR